MLVVEQHGVEVLTGFGCEPFAEVGVDVAGAAEWGAGCELALTVALGDLEGGENLRRLGRPEATEATQVAGFHTWRKMARFVRKGEKAIFILAPMVYKNADAQEGDDDRGAVRARRRRV